MEKDRGSERPTLLLVDDQQELTDIFKTILEDLGYTVFIARDGYEAIETYFRVHPDIVLMDLSLISVDGDVACKKILEKDPSAKILLLTALKGDKVRKALEAGALDVIPKPVSARVLVEKIQAVVKEG